MTHRAVLFDLDGTLLDTLADLTDAMNEALSLLGLPTHPQEACRYFVGDGLRAYALRALPEDRRDDEPTVQRCCEAFLAAYARYWHVKTRPYPGIAEMLDGLADRGIPAAVLSNKPDEFTRMAVERLLGRWGWAAVRGVRDDGVKKPDPSGALAIAADLDIAPAEVLYVGDTNTDMRTANAAGMTAIGATWGFRTPEELREHGAVRLIDRPPQLLELL